MVSSPGMIVIAPGMALWDPARHAGWLAAVVIVVTAACVVTAPVLVALTWRKPAGLRCGRDDRSAIPAAEAWYQDTAHGNSTYTGLTNAGLALEAPGVSPKVGVKVLGSGAAYACAQQQEGAEASHGPLRLCNTLKARSMLRAS